MKNATRQPAALADLTPHDVELAQQGNEIARRKIVDALHRPVLGLIHRFSGGGLDREAEDVAQDIFLKVFRNLHRFDPDRGVKLTTWVYTIVRNHCFDLMKKRRQAPASLSVDTEDGTSEVEPVDEHGLEPLDQALNGELGQQIDEAVKSLKPEHRRVFELREYQGLEYRAIARITGDRQDTIKSRLHRARLALRSHLETYLRAAC